MFIAPVGNVNRRRPIYHRQCLTHYDIYGIYQKDHYNYDSL